TAALEKVAATLAEHRAFLQTGYERGWLLMSGPQVPKTGGMVIARAPSMDELREFFRNDPYLVRGLATYRFVEFEPVKNQPFMADWIAGK
ncbi:MAG: hypothetical protein HGA53_11010, partial [Anaerolineaceae bacterium]|nr:hypothetical protein [Anaerolineaceae bacterium]